MRTSIGGADDNDYVAPSKENRPMPEKIIIVEDEIIVAMDLSLRLSRLGYDVIGVFSTGEEAVEECGKTRPDIILMDYMLRGELNGLEATKLIHSLYDTPVVMLSALPQNPDTRECDGYLVKPFELFGLKSTIENTLKNSRSMKAS
ncbi:MAG TPA: response regulator [bacterium]|nr:response regulator [bacterium]